MTSGNARTLITGYIRKPMIIGNCLINVQSSSNLSTDSGHINQRGDDLKSKKQSTELKERLLTN